MEKAKLGNVSSRKTIFPETVSAYGPCIISSLVSQKTMRLKKNLYGLKVNMNLNGRLIKLISKNQVLIFQ